MFVNSKSEKLKESPDSLRPQGWDNYIGQERIKKHLRIIIEAAKRRNETPDHILFYGPPGLGKTTISHIIAQETGSNLRSTTGPVIEKSGDLVALLTNLNEGDILFIDECHRINRFVEEYLYSAMEDFKINLILGKGPMAKTIDIKIPHFTLIGATTRIDMISSPLRSRFGSILQLNYYSQEEIERIIERSAQILGIKITKEAKSQIAKRSRFTPRIANKLLKRVRDFSQVEDDEESIDEKIAVKALEFLEVDNLGLEPSDRKIIETIINKFNGGPAGLQALSAATSEEKNAILEIYEPYLMQMGLIKRTNKGRAATKLAYEHLNLKWKNKEG
ncbi:MAG: Holliday junction branch migration DNA helicase RuvB [Candidatus Pacebacteria bacterium]|nr:Holliday junction branch migration DNA helicase RuvB [Candidatus Paceibacterota bacterium]